MQEQINAIKQLLETNNAIASQIEEVIVSLLGDRASWENSSTYESIFAFDSGHGSLPDDLYGSSSFQVLEVLWRSRIDLNDAKHHAELADLEEFATSKGDFNESLHLNLLKQIHERDREIESLQTNKSRFLELESLLETRNAEIENLKLALDAAKKPTDDLVMECDQLRRDLRDRDREIADLKQLLNLQCEETYDQVMLKQSHEVDLVRRNREIEELQTEINRLKSWLKKREDQLQVLWANDGKESKTADPKPNVNDLTVSLKFSNNVILEQNHQIEELQITVKNHREQFENLKSRFEVLLKAIAMNLDGLKGARKPDEIREVNGVMTAFRNYDDNLTHHHKTIIIENVQRAIAEEAKKLKGANLKDFSLIEIP